MGFRWTIAAVSFSGAVLTSEIVRAEDVPDPPTCGVASGQRARAGGKLLEARKHLIACTEAGMCAPSVQEECARLAAEVLEATPSILITARDRRGDEVANVSVAIDG